MQIITTTIQTPKICIYGVGGCGKSSFAAQAPSPIFIDTEGSLSSLPGLKAFPRARWLKDIHDALDYLIETKHQFKTLVIDTLDWMERLAISDCMAMGKVSDFSELKFGKGPRMLETRVQEILSKCDRLNEEKGMIILFLAHQKIVKFEDPKRDNYDRYTLDLYSGASADIANMIMEYVHVLGFVDYRINTTESKEEFGAKVVKAKGSSERILYLENRPAFLAKSRYSLGESLPFPKENSWQIFYDGIRNEAKELVKASKSAPAPVVGNLAALMAAQEAAEPEKYMEGK
jgi:hypothetical protein